MDEQKENDEIYIEDEVKYIVDKDLLQSYSVFNVDYSDGWLRNGFSIVADGSSSGCR